MTNCFVWVFAFVVKTDYIKQSRLMLFAERDSNLLDEIAGFEYN